ncbi:MAG: hypothetical protein GYB67_00320 [Chloroflexi bacterium]|nr:hypothetical protein [Chloroflexota bacterium]
MLRMFALLSLSLLIILAPILAPINAPTLAQDAAAPLDFPTLAALESATLSPRNRSELAQRFGLVDAIPPAPLSAPARQVGEQQMFFATNTFDDVTIEVAATLRVVGEHIYLWVEDGALITDATLRRLATSFDTRIYTQTRDLWGSEASPGIDGDRRIHALFASGLGATTAAYYASDHSFPNVVVPISNEHEMFFFNLNAIGPTTPIEQIESILAHEFQHMIRANVQINEDYWLNEGFSEFTQLYLYNDPGWEVIAFLDQPGTQLNTWTEASGARAADYGAALLFVTYFYERYGLAALRALSADGSTRGLDAVDRVLASLGAPGANDLFADWVVANWLRDPRSADGRYGYTAFREIAAPTRALGQVIRYPFAWDGEVNQYATDYIVLSNLDTAETVTISLSAPPTTALIPAVTEAGDSFWYSNRGDMSDTTLTRAFDLTTVAPGDPVTLDFRLWYHIENLWDYGYVMVSADDGASWEILATARTTTQNPHETAYGPGYTGRSGGGDTAVWVEEAVSLADYAGETILVRFEMITDDAITQPGMAVDDVRIDAIGYTESFAANDGGWQADGWIWMDNRLPQGAWVQAIQQIGQDAQVTRWQVPNDGAAWELPLAANVDQVTLAISPFAPVTTVPMPYTLEIDLR